MKTDLSFLDFIERIVKGDLKLDGFTMQNTPYYETISIHLPRIDFNINDKEAIRKLLDEKLSDSPLYISFYHIDYDLDQANHIVHVDFKKGLLNKREGQFCYDQHVSDHGRFLWLYMLVNRIKINEELSKRFKEVDNEADFKFLLEKMMTQLWNQLKEMHLKGMALKTELPNSRQILKHNRPHELFRYEESNIYLHLRSLLIDLILDISRCYASYISQCYPTRESILKILKDKRDIDEIDFNGFDASYLIYFFDMEEDEGLQVLDEVLNEILESYEILKNHKVVTELRIGLGRIADAVVVIENIRFYHKFVEKHDTDLEKGYCEALLLECDQRFHATLQSTLLEKIETNTVFEYLTDLQLRIRRQIVTEFADDFLQVSSGSLLRKARKLVDHKLELYHKHPESFSTQSVKRKLPNLKWNKDKVDFVELVAALHLTNSVIRKDGAELSMEWLYENLKEVFHVEVSDFHKKLHEARNRKKSKTILIDEMKKAFEENSDPGDPLNSKSRVRK